MATSRATSNRLLRLLRQAPLPIYVVDSQRTVVFCNDELAAWLGLETESIVGQQLDYDAAGDVESSSVSLAGLAPAPETLASGLSAAGSSMLVSRETAGEPLVYRRARLLPLGTPTDPGGVIVVVDGEDAAPSNHDLLAELEPSPALHEQIRQFRFEQHSRYALASLIGNDPALAQARRAARAAAACLESVLIVGPAGSGRSHVARSIHYESVNKDGRFVPLACELLDADELRDALRRCQMGIATADPPVTLMLADVDKLLLDAQVLLAQELTSTKQPLRVISTAAEPLVPLAQDEHRFRHGLARELTTIEIALPALRDRMGDLPLLAQVFLEEENRKNTHQIGAFSREALRTLAEHIWPGNLDELRETVRQAHQQCDTGQIESNHLSLRIRQAAVAVRYPRLEAPSVNLEEFLGQIESELIQRALAQAQGNKTKAAELLGMTRPRFYRRLEQLGMLSESDARQDD